jgi:hypothetical protein
MRQVSPTFLNWWKNAASITYLSKLVKIDAAVAPGPSSDLEQDHHCND